MRIWMATVGVAFTLLVGCTTDPGSGGGVLHSEQPPASRIWAAGDSITLSTLAWPSTVSEPVFNVAFGYEGFVTKAVRPETIGERIDHFIDAFGPPATVVIMGGRNDEQAKVSPSAVVAEIDRLDSQLVGMGIDVVWITPPGRVGVATPLTDGIGEHLRTNYPSRTLDCGPLLGTPTGSAPLFDSDGIHPNAAGHAVFTECVADGLGI